MTTENNEENKKETMDLTSVLEAIDKKVTEKLNGFSSVIDEKLSKKEEDDEPDTDFGDDDEEFFSKKHIPELVTKITKEVTKTTTSELELKAKKFQRDSEARRDFPELVDGTPVYNKKFYDEVGKEISSRVGRGRSSEDVDLIYDCAAAVAARGQREGWYVPKAKAQADHQTRNNREDHFSVSGGGGKSGEPNSAQTEFGAKVGLSKERLTQLLKKTGQYR